MIKLKLLKSSVATAKSELEWPQITWWTKFMNAASKAKDPGFKEMWKKKADDLVTASKEKKRKNLTSPSNSRPI